MASRNHLMGIYPLLMFLVSSFVIIDAQAGPSNSYIIKGHRVEDVSEALTLLRQFLPPKLAKERRCERYAILLQALKTTQVDQFFITELGFGPNGNQKLTVDMDTLRELYIEALNKLKEDHLDSSFIEIYDCLKNKFWSIDKKARSFLNQDDIKSLAEQYNSVMNQPLEFLVGGGLDQPSFGYHRLHPAMKRTLDDLIPRGDPVEIQSHFSEPPQLVTAGVIPPPLRQPSYDSDAYSEAQKTLQTLGHDDKPAPEPSDQKKVEEFDQGETEYINNLKSSLKTLNGRLQPHVMLPDRCIAFSEITTADERSIADPKFALSVADNINKKADASPSEKPFMPEKDVRNSFLLPLIAFKPNDIGQDTWVDILDCVAAWQDEDPEIRVFANQLAQSDVFDQIVDPPSDEDKIVG